MKHPRKSITPPSSKKMQRMALLSVKEEGEGASHPGGSAISLEDEFFNMSGDCILPSQVDSYSHELTNTSKGGLLHKTGSNALVRIIFTSCLSADDFKVAAMSASDVPDKLPIPMVINMEIKEQLKKEIREFGGQHEKILKLLEGVQGPPELQRKFVESSSMFPSRLSGLLGERWGWAFFGVSQTLVFTQSSCHLQLCRLILSESHQFLQAQGSYCSHLSLRRTLTLNCHCFYLLDCPLPCKCFVFLLCKWYFSLHFLFKIFK
uniref:INTS6/SAGE1/DDX26B/CT45 C-terminal domain-containing protein n=1 Tax=Canis lupus familiaris TaxID=9615 RepID=A0A8I3SAA1_CANLF